MNIATLIDRKLIAHNNKHVVDSKITVDNKHVTPTVIPTTAPTIAPTVTATVTSITQPDDVFEVLCRGFTKLSIVDTHLAMNGSVFWDSLSRKIYKSDKIKQLKKHIVGLFISCVVPPKSVESVDKRFRGLLFNANCFYRLFHYYDRYFFNYELDRMFQRDKMRIMFQVNRESTSYCDEYAIDYSNDMYLLSVIGKKLPLCFPSAASYCIRIFIPIVDDVNLLCHKLMFQFEHELLHFLEDYCFRLSHFSGPGTNCIYIDCTLILFSFSQCIAYGPICYNVSSIVFA